MKDFKNSWDQRRWESAAASYARWLPFMDSTNPKIQLIAHERLSALEKEYPQLKK